ncbi:FabD/lysophospholipase-like protein [Sistotremastrum suecicum HHB10207 ss-3]|uniref:FabD/lysophospholipase-like protein n=1 Tax=Sistotremastrum suecicum HHB10207 ss-3 TaxID=1314776 RepID=A0A165XHD3_9AGAM|nr:FabD/lysophospholipase-like protein [Sistotremastrum suecicum HHB10207 ss-3]
MGQGQGFENISESHAVPQRPPLEDGTPSEREPEVHPPANCQVWQAARATSAAPGYFKPMTIRTPEKEFKFLDGGLNYNNPAFQLLGERRKLIQEASRTDDQDPDPSATHLPHEICFISLGAGGEDRVKLRWYHLLSLPLISSYLGINVILCKIATDTEKAHESFKNLHDPGEFNYFRFNVKKGLEGVALGHWWKLSNIRNKTRAYLAEHEAKINEAAEVLVRLS